MLEKFLPFLKSLENPEKKDKFSSDIISDETLFFNPNSLREEVASANFVVNFASSVVIFFSVLLILILILHGTINFMLNSLLNEQRNLEYKMSSYEGVEEKAAKLVKRIDYSKRTVGSRKPLTTRISFVMTRIPSNISLITSDFTSDNFEVDVKGETPAHITRMLLDWLEDGGVSEVSIREAIYSSSENSYLVKLSGVYR
ncbi:MAG: hypothetical protein KatS3mg101_0010 [Patescibacteria group bacterium]|nr:MAG: hypothetical protein KatS3mg101_0010 [Patescibacteria group bacterium]